MFFRVFKRSGCLLLFIFAISLQAQVKSVISHYSTTDGLPDNRIRCIIKDSEGFMWFGSWAGISRFDGHNFVNFKSNPGDKSSLKSNRVNEIVDDKAGFIWVRAYDNQIYRFDKRTQQFLSISELLKEKVERTIQFTQILYADKETVWLKSINHGLFLITNTNAAKPLITKFAKNSKVGFELPSNEIYFLHLDHSKRAWVGTSAGLVVISKGKDNKFRSSAKGVLQGFIYTGFGAVNNGLWLTTKQGYLVHYNDQSNQVSKFKVSTASLNNLLISRKSDKVYCTTNTGMLLSLTPKGSEIKTFPLSDDPLFSIYEDQSGLLWIEPEKVGVYKLDPSSGKSRYFIQENLSNYLHIFEDYKIFEDNTGRVWTYMKGCGFGYYDKEKDVIAYFNNNPRNPYRRFSNAVTALNYDNSGVLWLSTDSRGLEKIVFQRNDFKQNVLVKGSFYQADNEVRSVFTDRSNRLWIGTKAGELFVYKNGKRLPDLFSNKPLKLEGIYCIFEDSKGVIWLGTKGNGIFKGEPLNQEHSKYKLTNFKQEDAINSLNTNTVYTIIEDKKGRIWAGSYGDGLVLVVNNNGKTEFLTNRNSFKNYPKGNFSRIRHLAEDSKGKIWIATTEGLIVFDPNTAEPKDYKFSIYKKQPGNINSLGGDDIQSIYRDFKNTMWLCTSTGGLNKAITASKPGEISFKNYSTKSGLQSDYVLNCTEDHLGNMWLATQNGITKFNEKANTFQNFTLYDGLQEVALSEGTSARKQNGELIFGTMVGYWSFNPRQVGTRKINANLVLTNLQINNEDVLPGDSSLLKHSINNTTAIELKYDQNTISIDFGILDYRLGEKGSYLYRLIGIDKDWQVIKGQRRATYTHLPSGNYQFEVKSQTEYLYSKVPYKSLSITILPPLWRTWWAYLIYFFIAVILFSIGKRIAFTMLRLRQRIAVERHVTDLKMSFFTQVSHELRTPLTLIINPVEEILSTERLSERGTEYISVVLKNARRMMRLINQLLDLRKAESGKAVLKVSEVEIVSFIGNVMTYFQETIKKRNLSVTIQSELKELLVWVDAEKMDIVIYNILANAIKFSPDNSAIEIVIEKLVDNRFRLQVIDEGIGTQESELEEIFKLYYEGKTSPQRQSKGTGIGLALSRELIELHEGKIYAVRNFPKGLKLVIELMLGKEHYNQENTQLVESSVVQTKDEGYLDEGFELSKVQDDAGKDKPLVLLVEDNDDLRNFLAGKLIEYYKVETAQDGEEGLRKARTMLPDLVLSDIMMPKLDGIQMLNALKNELLTSHIPVVLLTARLSVESQIEALNYGADYYIQKPFNMDLLQSVVSSLIIQRNKLFQALLNGKKISELSTDVIVTSHDHLFLEKVIKIVEDRLAVTDFNIDSVAETMGMSRSAFFKKFKSLTNIAPVEFVRETRLKRAKLSFDSGETNVSTVAYSVGFNNPKYFSTCFKAQFNITPTEYIKDLNLISK